jgi:IS5 family transposase
VRSTWSAFGLPKGEVDRPESARSLQERVEDPSDYQTVRAADLYWISAASTHDSQTLQPLGRGIPLIRSRRGPRRRRLGKLHADKGYDYADLRSWLHSRGITPLIIHRGIEPSTRLGRYRWW